MYKQVFINKDKGNGTSIPFSTQFHFDNGLMLSVIWVNGFALGDTADQIEMFEMAVVARGEVMDPVRNCSFQEVATMIATLDKLSKDSVDSLIEKDLLYTVSK